jgi:hypothetical protein
VSQCYVNGNRLLPSSPRNSRGDNAAKRIRERSQIKRFGDDGIAASSASGCLIGRKCMGGDGNDDDILGEWVGFQSACRFPSIHTRHRQVHQDNTRTNATSYFDRFFTMSSCGNLKLTKGEILYQHLAAINVVVNDEDTWFERH